MKDFTKIKTIVITLWVTIVSFLWKVFAQFEREIDIPSSINTQGIYWVPPEQEHYLAVVIIDLIKWTIIPITLIIWIISFIKIKRTDDEKEKKIKVKRTSTIITILILLTILVCLLPKILL